MPLPSVGLVTFLALLIMATVLLSVHKSASPLSISSINKTVPGSGSVAPVFESYSKVELIETPINYWMFCSITTGRNLLSVVF